MDKNQEKQSKSWLLAASPFFFIVFEAYSLSFIKALDSIVTELTLHHKSRLLLTLKKTAFENIVEEGENAGNQCLLLYPKYFLPF